MQIPTYRQGPYNGRGRRTALKYLFFLPAFSFRHFPFHEFNLQVGFVLVLFNLGDGGQQLRQFVDSRYGFAVVGSHGGGVGAFAKIVDADVFILVQVEESDYVAVFSYLVIRFFYFLSQVGGLIAVFDAGVSAKLPSGAVTFTAKWWMLCGPQ